MGFKYDGTTRPPFAVIPDLDQESVWDYPRPPRAEADAREVIVQAGERTVAQTRRAIRILETANAPTFYLPPDDVRMEWLRPAAGQSLCEWKGAAGYWDVVIPGMPPIARAAWSYADPSSAFASIRGHLSFYPSLLACFVGGNRVVPQPGGFYGGWVTPEIVGPVKGEAGTGWW